MRKVMYVLNTGNYGSVESMLLLNSVCLTDGHRKSFGHHVESFDVNIEKGDDLKVIVTIDNRENEELIKSGKIVGNVNLTLFIDDKEVAFNDVVDKTTYPYTMNIFHIV